MSETTQDMTNDEAIATLRNFLDAYDQEEEIFRNGITIDKAITKGIEALQERKMGKWIRRGAIHNMYTCYACSECGREIEMYYDFGNTPTDADVINQFPYCHCGAKMEVDE